MGSLKSWLGAFGCFGAWLVAHRFSSGWAAPSFLALLLASGYLWLVVLKVPKLCEELKEVMPKVRAEPAPVPAPAPAAPAPKAAPEPSQVPAPETAADWKAAVPMGEAEAVAAYGNLAEEETQEDLVPEGSPDAEAPPEAPDMEDDIVDAARAQELRQEGNEYFKAGRFHDAREAYSEALHLSPEAAEPGEPSKDRAVLHCNRAACMQRLQRWEDVVKDCSEAIQLDPEYSKAFARRSTAYEELEKWHDALEDLKKLLELDPSLRAKETRRLAVLEKRAQEQFEKDKDEMMGKLKELGNTVLGKFGMSTDNFKLEQDPDTGSYSIKFQS